MRPILWLLAGSLVLGCGRSSDESGPASSASESPAQAPSVAEAPRCAPRPVPAPDPATALAVAAGDPVVARDDAAEARQASATLDEHVPGVWLAPGSGELLVTELDLGMAVDGMTLGLRRSWDDRVLGGPFGRGWRHELGPDAPTCGLTARCDPGGHVLEVLHGGERLAVRWEHNRATAVLRQGEALLRFDYDGEGRIVSAHGADGRSIRYGYDDKDRLVEAVGPEGAIGYGYEGAWLSSRTTPDGVLAITWDDQWRVTQLQGPGEHLTRVRREELDGGHRTTVTDAAGTRRTYEFHPSRREVIATDGAGTITRTFDAAGRLRTLVDRGGGTHAYTWNPDGTLAAAVHPGELPRSYSYRDGRLVRLAAGDHEVRWSYDELGWLSGFVDHLGRETRWTRDSCGRVATLERPDGTVLRMTHDGRGRLASTTDGDGHTERRHYDDRGRLARVETATGDTVELRFDPQGRIAERLVNGERTDLWSHDARGRLSAHTDADGRTTTFRYDARGRVVDASRDGASVRLAYDRIDRIVRIESPLDQLDYDWAASGTLRAIHSRDDGSTGLTLDGNGRVIGEERAGQSAASATRDDAGRITASQDAAGHRAEFVYDELGRLAARRSAEEVATYERLPDGDVRETGLISGATTLWRPSGWDGQLRPALTTDEQGATRWFHDPLGRLIRMERQGERVEWTLDPDGRPLRVSSNRSGSLDFELDAAGRITRVRDGRGWERQLEYSAAGLLEAVREGESFRRYEYDARGRVVAALDPRGRRTGFAYGDDGRSWTVTDPAGRSSSLSWDALGRPVRSTRPGGVEDRFQYDAAGHLVRWIAGSTIVGRFEYDEFGRPLRLALGNANTQLQRDAEGRITSRSDLPGVSVAIRRDGPGRVNGRSTSSGAKVVLARDAAGRVVQLDADKRRISLRRNEQGHVAEMRCGEATVTYRHDEAGRLVGWTLGRGAGGDALVATFGHDQAGRLASVKVGDVGRSYTYDAHRRLVTVRAGATQTTYEYDAAGELVRAGGVTLKRDAAGAPVGGPAGEVALDAEGRVTRLARADGPLELRYDALGRLEEVRRDGAPLVRYTYGPAGELTSRTGATGTTRWVIDEDGKPLQRLDAAGGVSRTRTFLRAGGEHTPPLGFVEDGRLYCRLEDPAGSLLAVVDESGRIINRYEHGGYGEPELVREELPVPWRFHGRYVDPDTGLMLLGHRWYSPELRSFLQPDPLPPRLVALEAHPRYAFLAGDPVNHHDPLGTEVFEWQQGTSNLMDVCNQFQAGKIQSSYAFGNMLDGFKAVGAIEDRAGNMYDVWVKRVPGSDKVQTVFRNLGYKSGGPYGKANFTGNIIIGEQPSTARVTQQAVQSSTSSSSSSPGIMERIGDAFRGAKHGVQLFTRQIGSTMNNLGGTWGTLRTALPALIAMPGGTTIVVVGVAGSALVGYGIGTLVNQIPAVQDGATKLIAKAQGTDTDQLILNEKYRDAYLGERSRELEKQKIAKAIEEGKARDLMPEPTPVVAGDTADIGGPPPTTPKSDGSSEPAPTTPPPTTPPPTTPPPTTPDAGGGSSGGGSAAADTDRDEGRAEGEAEDPDDGEPEEEEEEEDDDDDDDGAADTDGEGDNIPIAFRDYPFYRVAIPVKFDEDRSSAGFKNIVTCAGSLSFWNVGSDVPGKGGATLTLKCTASLGGASEDMKLSGTFSGGPNGKFRLGQGEDEMVFYLQGGKSVTLPEAGTYDVPDPSVFDDYPM